MSARQPIFVVIVALPLTGFAACATYTERTADALRDFQGGQFAAATKAYADPETTDSAFLAGAEAGTVALTAGDWSAALEHYHRAAAVVEDIEGRALVGPERLGETLASWALNDTARAYQGEGFERVYLHCGLALAYLAQGKVDDVYVEARRANQLLEAEEALYETKYEAGGFGHLVSAVTYELIGELDDALIDYQRMEEKGIGTALAGSALVRLAQRLGRDDLLPALTEKYGEGAVVPEGSASVVVLAGVGLGPYKVESRLTLPIPEGVFQMAVPGYVERPQAVTALRLLDIESGESVRTDVVESVTKVALDNLEDRLGWMAAKSIARGILKRELTKKLEDEHGTVGRIAGDLFTLFSERADTRAWLTLPDSWQACRLFVPAGTRTLALDAVGGETVQLGTFEFEPGETLIVIARSLGPNVYAHAIGGKPVDPTAGAPAPVLTPATP
ncbi:MAG: hypothetical protein ABL998_02975 [Planctomycetota bacterium]